MATVRDAATVMLVRDAPDLRVFMLRRTRRAAFGPGAWVFPGGAVDPVDRAPEVVARVDGLDDPTASARLGLESGGLAFWVAAVREAFEEGGILLARRRAPGGAGGPVEVAGLDGLRRHLVGARATARDLLVGHDLVIPGRELAVFAHWVTPPGAPRRFDTWFFLARAPDGQDGAADRTETVGAAWVRPAEMVARGAAGEVDLIWPTRRTLEVMARFATAAALVDAVRGAPGAALLRDGPGRRIALPGDGGEGAEGVA